VNDTDRKKILAAFGMTEDDLATLEAETGWNAAQAAADQEREQFVAELRRRAEATSQELSEKLGAEVRWDDAI
jgi:F0F1-type ATP synthase membrane subunit b/b'